MNEKLTYAQMLDIPVNTTTITYKPPKKKRKSKKKVDEERVKAEVLEKVNSMPLEEMAIKDDNVATDNLMQEDNLPVTIEEGIIDLTSQVEQIDDQPSPEIPVVNDSITTSVQESVKKPKKRFGVIGVQLCVIGMLIATILLTNALFVDSGINTFMDSVFGSQNTIDIKDYDDFTPVINSSNTFSLENGVISFSGDGSAYSPCDGIVESVEKSQNGIYSITVAHSENFKTVIDGLTHIYVNNGDKVMSKIPVGYFYDNTASMCFMSGDTILTGFTLNDSLVVWAV